MNAFTTRANQAAASFLSRRGCEVIEQPWRDTDGESPIDLVAVDEDAIVFVAVKARDGEGLRSFPAERVDREEFESYAIGWCAEHEEACPDRQVRFDVISILAIGTDRAFIKHHINALSTDSSPEEE